MLIRHSCWNCWTDTQMRRRFLIGLLASAHFVCLSFAQEPAQRVLELRSQVQEKNFYVLSLLERTPGAAKAVGEEGSLARILERKRMALEGAAKSCETVSCVDGVLRWTDAEIAAGAAGLKKVYSTSDTARKMVDGALRESGADRRCESKGGVELPARAWA